MKKALCLVGFLAICSQIYAAGSEFIEFNELKYGKDKVAVGAVSASYSEKISLIPDTAEFSIAYLTEGATPNNASNQNVKNSDELKKYLKTLGLKDSDITTIGYKNSEQTSYKEPNEKSKLFKTELTVTFDLAKDQFYDIIKLLEKNGVTNLRKDDYNEYYYFTIESTLPQEESTKKDVQNRFQTIEKLLKNSGISELDIKAYDTKELSQPQVETKKYFVLNILKIKTQNFDIIGKIFSKAQELKMSVNNDLFYTVSEKSKQKIISDIESQLFKKLQEKAQRTIGEGYSVGVPLNVQLENSDIRYPRPMYDDRGDFVSNIGQIQTQIASEVSINPPTEYEIVVTMRGTFDIVQNVKQ